MIDDYENKLYSDVDSNWSNCNESIKREINN